MQFKYTAKDRQGKSVEGCSDGVNAMAVRQKLRTQGLFALSVVAADVRSKKMRPVTDRTAAHSGISSLGWSKRVKSSDLIMALSQLAIMCQSGDDLAEALKTVANQCSVPALKKVLLTTYDEVAQGVKFSDALGKHPSVFNESMVAALATGEQSGRIVEVLERTTRMMRKDQALRSSVLGMLMYPAVLCSITVSVICSMLFFVLPQFAGIFRDMNREVPPLTQMLLTLGEGLRTHWLPISVVAISLVVCLVRFRKHPRMRRVLDQAILNGLVIKNASRALITGRIFRLLGTMLENGIPLLDCIRLCRKATSSQLFQELFEKVETEILQGAGMSQCLINANFLPAGASHMVTTGERSGKLASVLQSVGEYYEDEGERRLRTLVKMLEPAIIIGLGGVVAVVVLSIILPLLDVTTASK